MPKSLSETRLATAFGVAAAMWLAGGAEAQTPVDAGALRVCAGISGAVERLACFDRLAAGVMAGGPGDGGGAPVAGVSEPAAVPAASSERFGKPPERPVEPNALRVQVASIERRSNGKYLFRTDVGQTWAQTDTTELKNLGKGPWSAEIRGAALGSYLLVIDGRAAVRVRRED